MLTISVKNFGPIAEGSVDLKPLTIFVGPSNTGKSYMATAVHAVMRAVEGRPQVPFIRNLHMRGIPVSFSYPDPTKASDEAADAVQQWVRQQDGKEWDPEEEIHVSALPDSLRKALADSTQQVLGTFHDDVVRQLGYGFSDISILVNGRASPDSLGLEIKRDHPLLKLPIGIIEGAGSEPGFDISQALIPSYKIEHWGSDYYKDLDVFPGLYHDFFFISRISAAEYALGGFPKGSYYLPAARSGTVQARRFLASSIIRQSSAPESPTINISGLPGTSAEFLSDLVSLDTGRTLPSAELSNSIGFIERHVLLGKIDLDESAGLPFPDFAYETDAGKFTLDQTSSMVSELAPLILFLKYLVRPGDLLILEEPESHLHPAAQRQLARGIVRLVNAGVQVLITTHSDIMISQINNLLALRQASPELVEQGGFEPQDFLEPEQVGAYLFQHNRDVGGSEVVRLEIDSDTGIDEDEFAAVFEAIYDESIALQRDRG